MRGVAACDALATYRSIVEAPRYVHPVADFVPGALLRYDLPDLAASLAPARLLVVNPQDALGTPLDRDAARTAFGGAERMAGLLGGDLLVEAQAGAAARRQAVVTWAAALGEDARR